MSKLYYMNRMTYGAAAGDPWLGALIKGGIKLVGGLFKKKGAKKVIEAAGKAAKVVVPAAAAGVAWSGGEALLGGGGGRGAQGSWAPRRSRGITARELRGYRKVSNLLHKEGMVSKRARGRKVC